MCTNLANKGNSAAQNEATAVIGVNLLVSAQLLRMSKYCLKRQTENLPVGVIKKLPMKFKDVIFNTQIKYFPKERLTVFSWQIFTQFSHCVGHKRMRVFFTEQSKSNKV